MQSPPSIAHAWRTRSLVAFAIAIEAWAAVAQAAEPGLPAPDGAYAVGTARAEFVDPSRRLDAADPASGPRRLPAIVWYPAERQQAADAAYLEKAVAAVTLPALARNFGYAENELKALASARVAARPGAPPAPPPRRFPVVVYSHGFFLYPEQNSALAASLASHGYIVVSIAHPGDAADVRLEDGRIVATRIASGDSDDPRFAKALQALVSGADLAARRQALSGYAEALAATRIGRSFAEWREDTLAVAQAILDGHEPPALRPALAAADRARLAFAGMSFGGATAATSCRSVKACRAAVNLDGQNFDPDLYDRPVGRPLLLMLSDWTRYGLFEGQPREADFSPNDLAYEPWRSAGEDARVVRVRLQGARHMGFTDLVALLEGPKRESRVGAIAGDEALSATADLVLAFLDMQLRDGDAAGIERAIRRHPALSRHAPERLQRWIGGNEAAR